MKNKLAEISFALAILGIGLYILTIIFAATYRTIGFVILIIYPLAILSIITSFILSIFGLIKIKKYGDGKGYAIFALIISSLFILLFLIGLLLLRRTF
ncbi:MAG: hypothetical protein KKD18_04520 [Nanoarchaeota archaeon]|nr:hypothetical protein [Nanoarchaeota archaeon]